MTRAHPTARTYYELTPPGDHATGDIWSDLPTHGLLKLERCAALIIPPACDLANNKVDTLTYLPVVPVLCSFSLPTFEVEVHRAFEASLRALASLLPEEFRTVSPTDETGEVNGLRTCLEDLETKSKKGELVHVQRALACLRQISVFACETLAPAFPSDLECILGAKWWEYRERIVKVPIRRSVGAAGG